MTIKPLSLDDKVKLYGYGDDVYIINTVFIKYQYNRGVGKREVTYLVHAKNNSNQIIEAAHAACIPIQDKNLSNEQKLAVDLLLQEIEDYKSLYKLFNDIEYQQKINSLKSELIQLTK
ncbi:hypothetical protein EBB07_28225 [Paenibacillaceae bacterium]|nr:hypothetical protein EBB07_28225 [Paenibacillaceae bacterium]